MVGSCMRQAAAAALVLAALIAPASGQAPSGAPTAQTEAEKKAAAEKAEAERKATAEKAAAEKLEAERKAAAARAEAEKKNARSYEGHFETHELAGGYRAANELHIPVLAAQLHDIPTGTIAWNDHRASRACPEPQPKGPLPVQANSKIPHPDKDKFPNWTVVGVLLPPPPCWWPVYQLATLEMTAKIGPEGAKTEDNVTVFKGPVSVSVFWFPFAITLFTVLLIYPGCAMAAWYAARLHYRKELQNPSRETKPEKPSFLASLDPVELTKNAYGRGSIGKLQIFLFTLIVFALLLFHLLRTGTIANMSTDVLMLLGISALGAAGGKLASIYRRRLSLENWAWLRRKRWLTSDTDMAGRAKWSELFLDGDTKEFDPYSFQMAIFSLVVAVALIRTNLSGLGTFKIPAELLALLGISQVVYIGGRAIDKGGYAEFDKKLDEVRAHEAKYRELVTKATAGPPLPQEAEVEKKAFKSDVAQAATMFWGIYGEQIGKMPEVLKDDVTKMDPDEPEPKKQA